MKNNVDIYKKLVLHFGNQAKTAKALNCKQPSVWAWVHGKAKMSATYDAGWFELKRQLTYKCENAGCRFEIVSERYTTQTCSCCGDMSSSPKGRAGLRIREWTCVKCGTRHDRDINASRNILAVGLDRLAAGIPSL